MKKMSNFSSNQEIKSILFCLFAYQINKDISYSTMEVCWLIIFLDEPDSINDF